MGLITYNMKKSFFVELGLLIVLLRSERFSSLSPLRLPLDGKSYYFWLFLVLRFTFPCRICVILADNNVMTFLPGIGLFSTSNFLYHWSTYGPLISFTSLFLWIRLFKNSFIHSLSIKCKYLHCLLLDIINVLVFQNFLSESVNVCSVLKFLLVYILTLFMWDIQIDCYRIEFLKLLTFRIDLNIYWN